MIPKSNLLPRSDFSFNLYNNFAIIFGGSDNSKIYGNLMLVNLSKKKFKFNNRFRDVGSLIRKRRI